MSKPTHTSSTPDSPSPNPAGIAEAVSYAASHGIIVSRAKKSTPGTNLTHAPMTYLPSPLHAPSYKTALQIAPILNNLLSRLAANRTFLQSTLSETATSDPSFTGRLLTLLSQTPPPSSKTIHLSIVRTDYFIHQDNPSAQHTLRMVEMNVIAASFACLGTNVSRMHRFLAMHPAVGADLDLTALPTNDAAAGLARGIASAHEQYVALYPTQDNVRCVTVMVIQPGDRNAYDQYLLRAQLWDAHGVEMVCMSLGEICETGRLNEREELCVGMGGGEVVVSVVYYRAGYTPEDYPTEREWEARAVIEGSVAVKCPTVAMQLVGTKKIQQVLDGAGVVERFVEEVREAEMIRATFARQYSLSAKEDGDRVAQMGIERPGEFVLKPQREGGGNNLYGEELEKALRRMSKEERAGYVLMERIRPVVCRNVVIRDGEFYMADVVSEFGVYGVFVEVGGNVVDNFVAGTLLRSKAAEQDDGGVAAGVAVLDSPLLVNAD